MTRRLLGPLALSCMLLAATAGEAATHHRHRHQAAVSANPVILTQQPGTALDTAARQLNAEDLASARKRNENPIVLIGSAPLSANHGDAALFVQLQSASLCGSAGCSTSVYLRHDGNWSKVLDSVSGPIKVLGTTSGGMHDLLVGDKDRWTWFGGAYHDTLPAAPIGNLKKSVERHQAAKQADGG
ncbi:hypothetical protein NFI95_03715 [Acetobacteraceae bacterium KSS8]|uniref:Lipoprotein n=1 Tax=Endosaccharibacter trunci TaxID=2812733 RepID=A0ABT1W3U3_9PROT|nr:hypothetical protein [Acetobacteraceae bacterium KSS8]